MRRDRQEVINMRVELANLKMSVAQTKAKLDDLDRLDKCTYKSVVLRFPILNMMHDEKAIDRATNDLIQLMDLESVGFFELACLVVHGSPNRRPQWTLWREPNFHTSIRRGGATGFMHAGDGRASYEMTVWAAGI